MNIIGFLCSLWSTVCIVIVYILNFILEIYAFE
jgi:hypothetical protein